MKVYYEKLDHMLKPLVPKFCSDLSVYLRDIAEKQVPAKLKPIVVQNRGVKRLKCFSIEAFCSKVSSGGSPEKKLAGRCLCVCMYVCMSVHLSEHFRLWSPNGWSDRGGRIFIQCAGVTERRWYRFRTDLLYVARAKFDCANICKKVIAKGAR